MPTKTKTKTTPADPMADYRQAVEAIERWTGELEAARAQVAALTAEPVTDPVQAKKTAAALAVAREYSHRCVIGVDNATDARNAAAAAVVTAEADDLAPEIDKARAELAEHDARTKELLAPLVEHSGREWAAIDPVQAWRARGGDGTVRVPASVRDRLAGRLRGLERRRDALLAAAQGGDPVHTCPEAELPDSLRPGGVLPSPSLLARQAQEAEQAQAEQEHAQLLAEAQAQVDSALEALGVDINIVADQPSSEWTAERGERWRARFTMTEAQEQAYWEDVNAGAARLGYLQVVAALAGWDAGTEAAAAALPTMAAAPANSAGEDQ